MSNTDLEKVILFDTLIKNNTWISPEWLMRQFKITTQRNKTIRKEKIKRIIDENEN